MHGGLTDADPSPGRGTLQAAFTAVAVLAALALFVSACATGGTGTRDEGPAFVESSSSTDMAVGGAASASPSSAPASAPSAFASDSGSDADSDSLSHTAAVKLVKSDPLVSAEVKDDLKPCVADQYPLDVAYGDLTGGSSDDVVVNVLTCGDGVGVGSYVYHEEGGAYENVFSAEESPVYAEIDSSGNLVVSRQLYEKGDPVSSPSGEDVITYRWSSSGHFVKVRYAHNELGDLGPTPSPSE
ncbi:hypothetical protein OG864_24035 [Streptomyces sp. NBC_00124]|uniref:hypothetical protein n=1 Tax=Streptomyces sp. NBC_00124 TaxID=2975662 RepID=UPI0022501E45|nr:hypothetical protein [Streptomyces sp. NBC_00124]MCX5361782.1 hypothetical protein [Streptomyces sp. NBC_00124]